MYQIQRDSNGIPHIKAKNLSEALGGLGYCHAQDRGLQMVLTRILAYGRASELLDSNEEFLAIDIFFRRMNWYNNTEKEIEKLSEEELQLLQAYCDGVNRYFSKSKPWECKVIGLKIDKWQPKDTIVLMRLLGYLSLAQSQAEIERLFVEMVQQGISKPFLNELFPNILDDYDENLLKKVKIGDKIVPDAVKWTGLASAFIASNNWVVNGSKTISGKPILASDPHLEVNRLPAVWYEVVLETPHQTTYAGTMPGVGMPVIGRSKDLAWGATYTFADAVDSWIEHCKEGKYLKEGEWHLFSERKEQIFRKKKDTYTLTLYENEHGTLDGNPYEDGYYLTTKWATSRGGATTIKNAIALWSADSLAEAMQYLGNLEISINWLIADVSGNLSYQMSGLVPKRRNNNKGFVPQKGWEKENDWQGYYAYTDLPRMVNPTEGFIVTANNNLNQYGNTNPINIPMGDYRARRIEQLLQVDKMFGVKDMADIQYDVYSIQAEEFMTIIKPLLPQNKNGDILRNWDLCYDVDSKGAFLFEEIYKTLYKEVFGEVLGQNVLNYLQSETGIFIDFYQNFDAILLSKRSIWFAHKTQAEIYKKAIDRALRIVPKTWGEVNKITMTNIFFGGKLPKIFGFDYGTIALKGNRATVHQGQIYRSGDRNTSFAPSLRMIADLSENCVHTNLAGGVSDRRFSKYYTNDVKNWLDGGYKQINGEFS